MPANILGFYYVSIPYFNHRRMKCAGQCPDAAHRAFYVPYFKEHGRSVNSEKEKGPYKVVILDTYQGDQIDTPTTL